MDKHPGMQGVSANAKVLRQYVQLDLRTYHEQLVSDDWVIKRYTSYATVIDDFRGLTKGTQVTAETVDMHRMVDGEIVKQHSHATMIDPPQF